MDIINKVDPAENGLAHQRRGTVTPRWAFPDIEL